MSNDPLAPQDRDEAASGTSSERLNTPAAPERAEPREATTVTDSANPPMKPPSLVRQAWNLAESLADFVADGCHLVSAEQYRQRLEICDVCDARRDNRCMKCGCRLSLKARGRAFKCPLDKWPA